MALDVCRNNRSALSAPAFVALNAPALGAFLCPDAMPAQHQCNRSVARVNTSAQTPEPPYTLNRGKDKTNYIIIEQRFASTRVL